MLVFNSDQLLMLVCGDIQVSVLFKIVDELAYQCVHNSPCHLSISDPRVVNQQSISKLGCISYCEHSDVTCLGFHLRGGSRYSVS